MTDTLVLPDDAALIARQKAILGRLAEIGLKAAEVIGAEIDALAAEERTPQVQTALRRLGHALDRVSRSTRLSLVMQERLINAPAAVGTDPLAEHKASTGRILTRIVERAHRGEYTRRQAIERLEFEFSGDILNRPVSEVIDEICTDLDVDPDWPRLAGEAWARAEMASGKAGWPLAGLSPNPLIPTSNPLIPAKAGTQIIGLDASG